MRQSLAITLAVLAVGTGILALAFLYSHQISKDLLLLTGQSDLETVVKRMGSPAEIFLKGEAIEGRGWRAPERENRHKVYVFIRQTGVKYFVYIDENDSIVYVFSSRS